MHILFLSDNFPPEVNAPAARTFAHCRAWVRAGDRVTVVTCAPNFPKGRVYPGYSNRLWQRETIDGIEVIRVWSYMAANEGFFRRTLDYASFMLAAILFAPWVRGVDVVVATSPQFFTACAGAVVAALKRKPFVFELRDLWPDSIRAVGAMRNERLLRALAALELALYRRADVIVALTHGFREKLIARGVDARKVAVVTNGAEVGVFSPRPRDQRLAAELGISGSFVAGYVGTHGLAHGLDTLLEAARRLQDHPEGRDVRFLFLGDGAAKRGLQARAKALALTNVIFLDSVPRAELARYWSLLDVAVIHLKRTELFESVIPSKLFECMAMNIPVLHGVRGESARIVQSEGVGLLFEPEDVTALVDRLLELRRSPDLRRRLAGQGARAAERYDRSRLARDMRSELSRALAADAPR